MGNHRRVAGLPLLDSDLVIWALRGDEPIVRFVRGLQAEYGSFVVSVITVYEVLQGLRSGEEERVREWINSAIRLPVSEEIAEKAAEYFRTFKAQGRTLNMPDLLIAATAFCHDLVLVTYNRKDFPMADICFWEELPPPPFGKPRRSR